MKTAALLIPLLFSQSTFTGESWPTRITPLFIATQRGDLEEMRTLIQQGADVNESGSCGSDEPWGFCDDVGIHETPLYAAIRSQNLPALELLLAHGANPNALSSTFNYIHPLTHAAIIGNKVIIEKLLQAGAYKGFGLRLTEEEQLRFGGLQLPKGGALSALLRHEHLATFIPTMLEYRKALVKKGLLKDIPDLPSQMLYMLLINKPLSATLITQLLELGANVNWDVEEASLPLEQLWDEELFPASGKTLGMRALPTPLHAIVDRAIYKDVPGSIIQLLLKHGANPHKKNNEGKSPIDMAREAGKEDLVKLLTSK